MRSEVTNFFWSSSTFSIFVITFNDIDDKIALYGSIVDNFLLKETISVHPY
jgi:hypothetical protein